MKKFLVMVSIVLVICLIVGGVVVAYFVQNRTYRVYGLNFSPYMSSDQDPFNGLTVSETQIRDLLTMIKPYTQWIRTYNTMDGLEHVGRIAHEMNLKVAAEAWIGTDYVRNQQQIDSLIDIGKAREADLLIVGSEVLLRGDLTETQLINYINTVKAAVPGVQVTTSETYYELITHPDVMAVCDVIMVHYYPSFNGISIDDAVYIVNMWHQHVLSLSGGKTVIVGETGWPSDGDVMGDAVPSIENAQAYFINFVSWARSTHTPYFYFEAFDEPWKTSEGNVGPHWGIWESDGTLKPGMDRVFNNKVAKNNWVSKIIGGSGTPTISYTYVPPLGSNDTLLEGKVLHVNPSDYRVVVYIKADDNWWIKPYDDDRSITIINKDGTWRCPITTGGNDKQATEITAYLIPKTYRPPIVTGTTTLPTAIDENATAKITITR